MTGAPPRRRAGPFAGRADAFTPEGRGRVPAALELYLEEIRSAPVLGPDRLAELARAAGAGSDAALDELVRATRPLVVAFARRYRNRGLPLEDLIQEGNVGLVLAARRFDPERGAKFSTFAVWWIRREIVAALQAHGRTVRLPGGTYRALGLVARTRSRLRQVLQREPTDGEVADAAGLDRAEVEVADALTAGTVSLEAPDALHDARVRRRIEALPALDHASDPAGEVSRAEMLAEVERALRALPARQASVLRMYYGVDGGEPRKLEEIGALLGVSRQSVHTMRDRALEGARRALAPEEPRRPREPRRRVPETAERGSGEGAESAAPTPPADEDLTDAQWAVVSGLLQPRAERRDRRGRRAADPRAVLDGIFWMLRGDHRWDDVPDRYPAARTCREHLRRWTAGGAFEAVLRALAADLEARGGRPLARWLGEEPPEGDSGRVHTARLLRSPATVRLLHRAGSSLLSAYPPGFLRQFGFDLHKGGLRT